MACEYMFKESFISYISFLMPLLLLSFTLALIIFHTALDLPGSQWALGRLPPTQPAGWFGVSVGAALGGVVVNSLTVSLRGKVCKINCNKGKYSR